MVRDNFKRYFPYIANDVEDVIEVGDTFMDVLMKDGSRLVYDDIDNTIRTLPKDIYNMSKDECGKEFGIRLRRIMHLKGVTELTSDASPASSSLVVMVNAIFVSLYQSVSGSMLSVGAAILQDM